MASKSNDKWTYIVSRVPKEKKEHEKPIGRKATPAALRENALADIARRLGESQTWDQKANNAFVYFALPTFTSFIMAYEKRLGQLVDLVNATITECTCREQPCEKHLGRSIIIKGGIFENTNTLTEWITNFFQQSPSINGLARENQVEIATAGYKTAAVPVWTPFGTRERAPEAD